MSAVPCPCRRRCPRHGDCGECRKHHASRKSPPYCERMPRSAESSGRGKSSSENIAVVTERLTVSPISNGEMEKMIAGEKDPELKAAYGEMLEGCVAHESERIWYAVWRIVEKATGRSVGDLSFKGISGGTVEIGYGLYEGFCGKGFAAEAVTAMSRWAFGQSGVKRVEAETEPDNLASQRVLARSGYIPTGELGREGPRFVYIGEAERE